MFIFYLLLLLRPGSTLASEDENQFNHTIEGSGDPGLFDELETELCEHCRCYQESDSALFLDCSSLNLESIPEWLYELENETDSLLLDLSYNAIQELSSLPNLTVWNLDLSKNGMKRIGAGAFKSVSGSVLQLDLSDNKLDATGLEKGCFEGYEEMGSSAPFKLIQLSLAKNRIHTVNGDIFVHLTELTDLDLSDNPIGPMTNEMTQAINGIVTLKTLNLRSTGLTALPAGLLAGLLQLTYLDLSGNSFIQVDPSLQLVPSLETLILDNNLIPVLDKQSFEGMENLVNISISDCHDLRSVEEGTFRPLANLQRLRISNNRRLEWISPDAWPTDLNIPFVLQELDLSGNNLRYLPSMLLPDFTDWKKIQIINIQDNPWWCDCHNEWMINTLVPMIMDYSLELTQDIVCKGPRQSNVNKESMVVVHDLGTNNLPCDDIQFDPWKKNFNLPQISGRPRPQKHSLPLAMTVICVIAVMATSGMIGLLYLQKAKQQRLPQARFDPAATAPRIKYRPANPAGQPGLETEGGIDNTEYQDDEEVGAEPSGVPDVVSTASHPFTRPQM